MICCKLNWSLEIMPDPASKNQLLNIIRSRIDQFAHLLQSTDIKEYIQMLILEPFLKYVINRIFPYIIIAFCLFGAIFLFVVVILVLLVVRKPMTTICPFCSGK